MKKVVVVDDELITRMDFSEMLEEYHYNVVAVGADGFDAIELCRVHNPDLLLMDVKMPLFDGMSAAQTIIAENTAVCIVLLTAFSDKAFVDRAKEIGVHGYLTKPVDAHTLIPAIEVAMEQSNRYQQALRAAITAEKKLEDKNIIDRAKSILAKRESIQEGDAYGAMQKMAMDKKVTMTAIAEGVLVLEEDKSIVDQAKKLLIKKQGLSENEAYKRLKKLSQEKSITIGKAARIIIKENS